MANLLRPVDELASLLKDFRPADGSQRPARLTISNPMPLFMPATNVICFVESHML